MPESLIQCVGGPLDGYEIRGAAHPSVITLRADQLRADTEPGYQPDPEGPVVFNVLRDGDYHFDRYSGDP